MPWRYISLYERWDTGGNTSGDRRILIGQVALAGLVDWPTLLVATAPVLLTIYRVPGVRTKFAAGIGDGIFAWHAIWWTALGNLAIDLPCILVAIPVLASIWRAPELIRDIRIGMYSRV